MVRECDPVLAGHLEDLGCMRDAAAICPDESNTRLIAGLRGDFHKLYKHKNKLHLQISANQRQTEKKIEKNERNLMKAKEKIQAEADARISERSRVAELAAQQENKVKDLENHLSEAKEEIRVSLRDKHSAERTCKWAEQNLAENKKLVEQNVEKARKG